MSPGDFLRWISKNINANLEIKRENNVYTITMKMEYEGKL